MKKFLSLFIALVLVISTLSLSAVIAFAEDEADDTAVPATGIKLEPSSQTVYKGEKLTYKGEEFDEKVEFTIKATLTPAGAKGHVSLPIEGESAGISWSEVEAEEGAEEPTNEYKFVVTKDATLGKHTITATLDVASEGEEDEDAKVISAEFTLNVREELSVNEEALLSAMKEHSAKNLERNFAMSDKFQLDNAWLKVETGAGENKKVSAQNVRDVFEGIDYYIDGEKDADGNDMYDKDHKYDVVSVEYLTPSGDPKVESDWKNIALSSTFSMRTAGWWQFRYIVKDSDGTVIARTPAMSRYAIDTQHPVVKLSTSLESKQKEGLKVAESYSISTYLDITDDRSPSDTTTTYVVQKKINGEWVEIYNSVDKVIADEYKEFMLDGGSIKPLESDVITAENNEDKYIYRIIYSVKDGEGFFGVANSGDATEFHPTLNLFVSPAESEGEDNKAVDAWKIVLYVVAGLSAVGIIVLLCIKPKQEVVDGRISSDKAEEKAEADVEEKSDSDNE